MNPDFWHLNKGTEYTVQENEKCKLWYTGVFIVKESDPLSFAEQLLVQKADFNGVSGWYRMVIYDKRNASWVFFGDNCGSQFFIMDGEKSTFSDSLLMLRKLREANVSVDYQAVADLFDRGRILGNRTLIKELTKTDADSYYCLHNGRITVHSKDLMPFSEMSNRTSLDDVIDPILHQIGNQKICAVCTGGTDSRVILANLVRRGLKPDLVITGHEDNPDIGVAQRIADKLQIPLTVISPQDKEENWLEKAIVFLDAAYSPVEGYRHLQKAYWAKENGYEFEFGGVGGEFYKNRFCMPARWGFPRKVNADFYKTHLLNQKGSCSSWCGEKIKQAHQRNLETHIRELAQKGAKANRLLDGCNRIGYALLKSGAGAITNGYASVCSKVDPLMDRNLVAAISQKSPYQLVLHMWHRKQVSRDYPEISAINTDLGFCCSMNPIRILHDIFVFIRRKLVRIKMRLMPGTKDLLPHYWDMDHREARETECWIRAVECCKKNGVIPDSANEMEIPIKQTGNIILIGMLFDEQFINNIDTFTAID